LQENKAFVCVDDEIGHSHEIVNVILTHCRRVEVGKNAQRRWRSASSSASEQLFNMIYTLFSLTFIASI